MFGHRKHLSYGQYPQQERRWMQRIPVSSSAIICNQDDACLQCTITSFNANGMLILAEDIKLNAGCYTTVELTLECEDGIKYQSETVRVVHCGPSHVAVAFVDYSSCHLHAFHKLLHTSCSNKQDTAIDPPLNPKIVHMHQYR